jgi:hypothetical protein
MLRELSDVEMCFAFYHVVDFRMCLMKFKQTDYLSSGIEHAMSRRISKKLVIDE